MVEDPWLAERLGRPVLTFEAGDAPELVAGAAAQRAPAFAQAKIGCADVATTVALQDAGFRVVDVNVTLSRAAGAAAAASGVDEATEADRDAVLEIAGNHYGVSRFHRDAAIPDELANAIKRDWATALLEGRRGDRLLVVRRAQRAVGFLGVLAPSPDVRVIDLVAVHSTERRSGVGRALVEALLVSGDGRVEVGTQIANTGSLRFYERLGFSVKDTRYVLHLHT
jgi:ribosomal protein S18 acetylase RimI-like enzyme